MFHVKQFSIRGSIGWRWGRVLRSASRRSPQDARRGCFTWNIPALGSLCRILLRPLTTCYAALVNRARLPAAGALVVAFALLATACAGAAEPEGWAPPVFDDGEALLFLEKDELSAVAFDGETATVLWTFPDGNLTSEEDIDIESVYTEPVIAGEFIYLGGYEGQIYAIGRGDGRLRWSTDGQLDIDGSIVSGPVLAGDRLLFGTTEGFVYAVDAADGSPYEGWPEDGLKLSGRGVWATPIVRDNVVYLGTMDGKLSAIDLVTVTEVWSEPFSAESGAIAELSEATDGRLFVATLGKQVFFVEEDTGTQAGRTIDATAWVWTRPAIEGDVAYYGDFDGSLYSVDINTQSVIWTAETDGRVKAGPAVVGDWVVFADESPAVVFVHRESGQVRNRVPISDAGTIRASVRELDGFAYVVTTQGKLFRANPENFSVVEIPIVGSS